MSGRFIMPWPWWLAGILSIIALFLPEKFGLIKLVASALAVVVVVVVVVLDVIAAWRTVRNYRRRFKN